MAVASASAEAIDLASPVDRSVSKLPSDAASDSSSSRDLSSSETPDRNYPSTSSPNPSRDAEIQSLEVQRSEEYRQLFRLPPEEALVQDFNCAYQESILLQGHMYLFFHYICFYSNIFGFETKKIIPFHEVTSVKRAKTAGIFPTAIEIIAAGRKYFFASFLSRDEAFKLINEGWEQHGDGDKQRTEQQGSISDSSPGSGSAAIERVNSSKHTVGEPESVEIERVNSSKQSGSEPESADGEKDSLMVYADIEYDVEPDPVPVVTAPSTSADDACLWKPENSDAPNIPECYTKVAEAQFQITVQDFFDMFFSDNAVSFVESFHRKCGDKEFRCSSWYPHEKFGHARDVSFQHPIKIYFGAKFGSCQEVQKFRIYRNSHLIIETSQEINDVPYGDYFQVEGLWDVHRDTNGSSECCVLRIYVNVAFSKRTVWKGKIVQSTQEECREAYATWIEMAQELLKQKHENKEEPTVNSVSNGELKIEKEHIAEQHSERMHDLSTHSELHNSNSVDVSQRVNLFQTCLENVISISSQLKEYAMRSYSSLQSRSQVSLVLATAFVVIFLMQVSILVLLSRPQQIHMVPVTEYAGGIGIGQKEFRSAEAATWLERRLQYLKEDVVMVEARLERMQHEHAALKRQIKELEQLRRRQAHMA